MAPCPSCGRLASVDDRFCPGCGTALANPAETVAHVQTPPGSDAGRLDDRFALGERVADRYRIVAGLGRGGMGDVYRADDLILEQCVALKFLPANVAGDPDRMLQFRQEVAAARRVSHPNVCRVYDIAEHAGQPFLAMEYVDGEDLSSLLRRLGRLPEEKGLQIARELCSALAAVHAEGLLHRDLKPANVMLDGRGRVRLTDFGVAIAANRASGDGSRAGTPLYMAPEQLANGGASERSDLFALGLVLYELFTGRKAFPAKGIEELQRRYSEGPPERPSSHAGGIHPAVERVILRCLAADPAERPASAAEVLAGLPGGDPLAAALAAGETPSPNLVAAAGGSGRLRPRVAVLVLTGAVAVLFLISALNDRAALFRQVPQDLSPRELDLRARQITQRFGYIEPPADRASGIATDENLLQWLRKHDPISGRWRGVDRGWPAVMYYWRRQSPAALAQRLTSNDATGWTMPGWVTPAAPPFQDPGETCVFLDLAGRLIEFHAVPEPPAASEPAGSADWAPLLAAAGLEALPLEPTRPGRIPAAFADQRAAWEGTHPDRPDLRVHVEAAAFAGRPIYFHVGVDDSPDRINADAGPQSTADELQDGLYGVLGLAALTIGPWLAWRNRRLGRADRAGAFRLAIVFAGLTLVGWLLTAKHVQRPGNEFAMFAGVAGRLLLDTLALWFAYLALEPVVRRGTPWRMIGWNRLLAGRWHDPRVGRDLLVGVLVGAAAEGIGIALRPAMAAAGWPAEYRVVWDVAFTDGAAILFPLVAYALLTGIRDFFLFVLIRLVVRRDWAAAMLTVGLLASVNFFDGGAPWIKGWSAIAFYGLAFALLLRFGFLAYLACNLTGGLFTNMPIALDGYAWYSATGFISLALLIGLAVFGAVVATRGTTGDRA
jgi:serine/threonine-protein kinase